MTDNNAKKTTVDSGQWEMANVTPGWGKAVREAAAGDSSPGQDASRSLPLVALKDRTAEAEPTGFPWALIVQILMAVLTYLIQRAIAKTDQDYLTMLRTTLERWEEKR